ncbi:hypothetical protein [Xanthomonas campestris]|nr:hypothetical protein [Xanthomonas campestris]
MIQLLREHALPAQCCHRLHQAPLLAGVCNLQRSLQRSASLASR